MLQRDPRRLAAWAAAVIVLALLAAWYLARSRPAASAAAAAPVATIAVRSAGAGEGGARVVVDVAGAVRRPGVYRLKPGARVEEALKRAGGATKRADLSQINRAAKVEDGRQILVPTRAPRSSAAPAAPTGSAPAASGQPLNLNTATLEQLDELDGVGPATAEKILAYRAQHNGFGSVDELDQIPGIGEKRLASLREQVRV